MFCYDKLRVEVMLVTRKRGFGFQKGQSIQPLMCHGRKVPKTGIAWEIRVMTKERVLCFAASNGV